MTLTLSNLIFNGISSRIDWDFQDDEKQHEHDFNEKDPKHSDWCCGCIAFLIGLGSFTLIIWNLFS